MQRADNHHLEEKAGEARRDVATLLWQLVKTELTPYPARVSIALRMAVACTLVMIVIMWFRIPGGALGTYFPFLMPRDSVRSTWRAVGITILVCLLGTAQILLGAALFAGSPLAHFLWAVASMFVVFYCISAITLANASIGLGLLTAGGIGIWDAALSSNARVALTLYLLLSVLIGCILTAAVEWLFSRSHPPDAVLEGIRARVALARQLLYAYAEGQQPDDLLRHHLLQYARRGTGYLSEILSRSDYTESYRSRLAAALSLSHDLMESCASMAETDQHPSELDRLRLQDLTRCLLQIEDHLKREEAPERVELPDRFAASRTMPSLSGIERTIDLLADAFTEGSPLDGSRQALPLAKMRIQPPLLAADAFRHNRHLRFATRGALAAMLCYLFYLSAGWKGLNASVVTCFLTALTSVGVTRQRQLLRLLGVFAGGCVLGIGSQTFLLPWIETLPAFALIFAACMFVCAWVATSGPRLAFAGAQMALAYDLVNLNSFGINTSLVPARDALLGILLGLVAMWLIYDHLWATTSTAAHKMAFVQNLRHLGALAVAPHTRNLSRDREQISRAFEDLRAFADSLVFEPHVADQADAIVIQRIRKWQPLVRSLCLVQFGLLDHIEQNGLQSPIATKALERTSAVLQTMVNLLKGEPADLRQSEALLRLLASIEHLQQVYQMDRRELIDELRLTHSMVVLAKEVFEKALTDTRHLKTELMAHA